MLLLLWNCCVPFYPWHKSTKHTKNLDKLLIKIYAHTTFWRLLLIRSTDPKYNICPLGQDFLHKTTFQSQHGFSIPASIYLLKVNIRNTRTRCKICSKLTIKTPEQCYIGTRASNKFQSRMNDRRNLKQSRPNWTVFISLLCL